MWLAGLHSVWMESTLHRPSSSLPVSGECKTCLLWIFPRQLQSLFMVCCCLPQAQHQHAPHLSSVMVAGAPLQAASHTSSPHQQWPSPPSPALTCTQTRCLFQPLMLLTIQSRVDVRLQTQHLQKLHNFCNERNSYTMRKCMGFSWKQSFSIDDDD